MEIKFVFEVVLLMIVGSFGVIGNCLLIRMFAKLKQKLNFHQLMITLAIFDTIYILLCMIVFAMPEILPHDYKREGYHFYVAPKAVALLQVTLTGSVYFTISISVERYLTVCHPFYIAGKNWSAKRYIIPIVLFSVMYNMTRFFEIRTNFIGSEEEYVFNVTKNNETFYSRAHQNDLYSATNLSDGNYESNSTMQYYNDTAEYIPITSEIMTNNQPYKYEFELTSMRKNKYYYTIYIICLNFIFNGLIPFAVIISLNVLLYKELATIISSSRFPFNSRSSSIALPHYGRSVSATSLQNKTRRSSRRLSIVRRIKLNEIMLAKVSIGIVIVFVICHSVKWIPNVYELIQRLLPDTEGESIAWPLWVQYITEISHFLTVLNSSANFYIYYITHYGVPISVSCLVRDSESHSPSSGIEM